MSDVDPFEHTPVYKYDQVVTEQDLIKLWELYYTAEVKLKEEGKFNESFACCISHTVIESLGTWIREGKPDVLKEDSNG